MTNETRHYSDQTLAALVERHGWEMMDSANVRKTFEGVGPVGTMTTPNGQRNLYAGYGQDAERRRYIALTLGDKTITDLDGRDQDPELIAASISASADHFADERRAAQGLPAKYSQNAPRFEVQMQIGSTWENVWHITDEHAQERPQTFTSIAEAQAEIDEFFADIQAEIDCGDRAEDEGYDREDFRIAIADPAPAPALPVKPIKGPGM